MERREIGANSISIGFTTYIFFALAKRKNLANFEIYRDVIFIISFLSTERKKSRDENIVRLNVKAIL
jgi:hypothetical protein